MKQFHTKTIMGFATLCMLISLLTLNHAIKAQFTPDPGLNGPYTVVKDTYDLGELAYHPPSFPSNVEVRGSVHYPSPMTGPYPVIMFLHGRHDVCYEIANPSNTPFIWPCGAGNSSILSFDGYDYLARQLASHGYIVISISANAINAIDNSTGDYGMNARGELMQHHLDLWNTWNTVGGAPFGTRFVGKLDMQNIGTMGHSRGGEGAVFNALLNRSLGSPYGIKAVLTLAPVDFLRHVLNYTPLLNLAPYCDGDVADLQGVHFYDDARYPDSLDEAPKHMLLMMGANHNYYNTVWTPGMYIAGGIDDWDGYRGGGDVYCGSTTPGNKRLSPATQQAALKAYLAAFYRYYLGHETVFAPLLNVEDIHPPASSLLDSSQVFLSYHPGYSKRMDVNRMDTLGRDVRNTLGANVSFHGLDSVYLCSGGGAEFICNIGAARAQEPHGAYSGGRGLSQQHMKFNQNTDYYDNAIPTVKQDFTGFVSLQFRAAVNFQVNFTEHELNFSVQIIDSFGHTSSLDITKYNHVLFKPPGSYGGVLPKVCFNTIKIPLADFHGVNMTCVRNIRFLYNRSVRGAVLFSDLAVTGVQAPCGIYGSNFGYKDSLGQGIQFYDSTTVNQGDTLIRNWNFGDTINHINTSTAANPLHHYFMVGNYTVCLYTSIHRANGMICSDTVCKSIYVSNTDIGTKPGDSLNTAINNVVEDKIKIWPNPASDNLYVRGASPTDVLTLYNSYGQEAFVVSVYDGNIHLPATLSSGIYYAVISGDKHSLHRKILISR